MLMNLRYARRLARDERGFTLMETLVAMVTGLIVTGALFAILEVSLHQSARAVDVVQATQMGRITMTRLVQELRSACLSPGFTPVQEKSTGSELVFIGARSEAAAITSAEEHQIVWNKAAGTLTDYTYKSTKGEAPNFTFPKLEPANASPPAGIRIGEKVSQTGTEPIFQYYKYASATASSASEGLSALTPLGGSSTEALGATKAKEASSVVISFNAAPVDGNTKLGRSADFKSQVTFAFSAPDSESTIVAAPCE
jgi:hypothetical protein